MKTVKPIALIFSLMCFGTLSAATNTYDPSSGTLTIPELALHNLGEDVADYCNVVIRLGAGTWELQNLSECSPRVSEATYDLTTGMLKGNVQVVGGGIIEVELVLKMDGTWQWLSLLFRYGGSCHPSAKVLRELPCGAEVGNYGEVIRGTGATYEEVVEAMGCGPQAAFFFSPNHYQFKNRPGGVTYHWISTRGAQITFVENRVAFLDYAASIVDQGTMKSEWLGFLRNPPPGGGACQYGYSF